MKERPLFYQGITEEGAQTQSDLSDEILMICDAVNQSPAMVSFTLCLISVLVSAVCRVCKWCLSNTKKDEGRMIVCHDHKHPCGWSREENTKHPGNILPNVMADVLALTLIVFVWWVCKAYIKTPEKSGVS